MNDRCIHCGFPKKDHGRGPRPKCPMRFHDTRWHGWRDGECKCDWCVRGLYQALARMLEAKK